jgi:signal peptidase
MGGEEPVTRRLVRLAHGLALAALIFSLSVLSALGVTRLFGFRSLTVMSGSMEPHIHVGDVVFDRTIAPIRAHVGDVVTFRDPQNQSRLLTHRVRSVKLVGTRVRFVTRGDANTGVERWNIDLQGKVGIVSHRIVGAGYVLVWLRTPLGRLLCIILPVVLLGGRVVRGIWRPSKEELRHECA